MGCWPSSFLLKLSFCTGHRWNGLQNFCIRGKTGQRAQLIKDNWVVWLISFALSVRLLTYQALLTHWHLLDVPNLPSLSAKQDWSFLNPKADQINTILKCKLVAMLWNWIILRSSKQSPWVQEFHKICGVKKNLWDLQVPQGLLGSCVPLWRSNDLDSSTC